MIRRTTRPPTITDEERTQWPPDKLARFHRRRSDFQRSRVNEVRRRLIASYRLSDERREGTTLDALVSTNPEFRVAVADQQFDNREATMYGVIGTMNWTEEAVHRLDAIIAQNQKIIELLSRRGR